MGWNALLWPLLLAAPTAPQAVYDAATGRCEVSLAGQPVLRYNYRTVDPGPLLEQVAAGNRIYCRSRSNYLHPLYGLDGEVLTSDFAVDHPHHRGIYWAWPETMLGDQLGDLHALQRVFARPTGHLTVTHSATSATLSAANVWLWDDAQPIVDETIRITVLPGEGESRVVDLDLSLLARVDAVSLARRATNLYGGLNLRLAPAAGQQITFHCDPPEATPRRAWSDLSGTFGAGRQPTGLTVLQHPGNPEYPGDWVQFPNLNWFQPTFPTAGTRRALSRETPLRLRWRLIVHAGPTPSEAALAAAWAAYAAT
ncbi:MAG: PmoA family protein [Fimbriimonadaceae bacterium]|nr:PmoA family protein [Fimbriimonadaceae bacterium]